MCGNCSCGGQLVREQWDNVTWLECRKCGAKWDEMVVSHIPTIRLLCRLERPSTGSFVDIEINVCGPSEHVDRNLGPMLTMVYPGWDLVSYCPA